MGSTMGSAADDRVRPLIAETVAGRGIETVAARSPSARRHSEIGLDPYDYDYLHGPVLQSRPARSPGAAMARPNWLQMSAVLLFAGCLSWCLMVRGEFRSLFAAAPALTSALPTTSVGDTADQTSSIGPWQRLSTATADDGESPAGIIARDWSMFQTVRAADANLGLEAIWQPVKQTNREPVKVAQREPAKNQTSEPVKQVNREPAKVAEREPARVQNQNQLPEPVKQAKLEPPPTDPNPEPVKETDRAPAKTATVKLVPVRVAALESGPPQFAAPLAAIEAVAPHAPANAMARTTLVDFESAPFPYHGKTSDSDRSFLNAGEEGHRGHVNFRGRVLWESETFNDDHVLLHIPPGFDPNRPAVMVVFFHGHGANLARDVRDRQQVPAQITAAGVNAVVVAPQFAVDAADSSAGKFWEPNGFKRFLDEAARKLAGLYGDPRSAAAFANMPIVLVAYSGGFGPTLSVLARGGVKSRLRGLVLLDALYAGIDQFADWIADNRSTFFVSSYTPHTAHHNADLEHALRERSVPYGSELRQNHLQGMVAFLPAGDVPHRDFVTHAWADYPIEDVLLRMADAVAKIETARAPAPASSSAYAAPDRN
jgi:hypothetical protein